ncbi:MAG: LytTR family DNA-binding domain-containing protein [Bacteroidota bacterium]
MRVAIIDDEINNIETLKLLLKKSGKDIQVIGEASSAEEGLKMILKNKGKIDILFLDIQMPNGDGFYLLSQLDKFDFRIIFVTAYDQFAIQAIRFSALDYLLKPVDPKELYESLDRFVSLQGNQKDTDKLSSFRDMLAQNKNLFERVAISSYTDVEFVHIKDICYLKSDNNYTSVYTNDNAPLISSKNIGYYEELFENHPFCRIHNSYLVNLNKVKKYVKGKAGYLEMENGIQLEISVRRKEEVLSRLKII